MYWIQKIVCMLVYFNFYFIRWIWQRFQFLSQHITQVPRRTVASFSARLQPAAGAPPAAPAPEAPEDAPSVPEAPGDAPPASTPASSHTSSTAGANPDILVGLLETFLTERQGQAHPSTAFGSYVDGTLRSLPPAIRRTAEARIMEVLHECQNEADRQQFRTVQLLSCLILLIHILAFFKFCRNKLVDILISYLCRILTYYSGTSL